MNTDSSTAKSITARKGAGRVRHIEVRVQDRVAKGELKIVRVKGEDNVADGLTMHVGKQQMEQYMKTCEIVRKSERHEQIPMLGESV